MLRWRQRLIMGWLSLIFSLTLVVVGCASNPSTADIDVQSLATTPHSDPLMTIALGNIETTNDGLQIVLTGSQPFSYSFANHDEPLHLTVDIPQAQVQQLEEREVGYGGVKRIHLSQVPGTKALARLQVHLEDKAVYSVVKNQEQLFVQVRSPQGAGIGQQNRSAMIPAAAVNPPSAALAATTNEYRVGPGDVLAISVYGEPDLTRNFRISERGTLPFPLIGSIAVQGLTAEQVAVHLERSLSPRYLRHPQIFVDVAKFASKKVFVVGAVASPQTLILQGETTLLEILSNTDGISNSSTLTIFRRIGSNDQLKGGNQKLVQTIRVNLDGLLRQGDMSHNLVLHPQDVVYIPKPDAVFVFGEVNRTGPIALPEGGMKLIEVINKAGGFTDFASANRTRVMRIVDDKEQVIQVSMADVIKGDLGKDIILKANDIVIVPGSIF